MPHRHPMLVPVAATAQRPRWGELPAPVRHAVEEAVLATVVRAESQDSGYTPGFASRLWLSDGRTLFAKGIGDDHQWLVEAYRTEAAKLAVLPAEVPAPRSLDSFTVSAGAVSWFVLLLEDVDGAPPTRPWGVEEARRVLQVAREAARVLTPAPKDRAWAPIVAEIDPVSDWSHARSRYPIGVAAETLSLAGLPRLSGTTLVHTDLRDDNVVVGRDGRIWFCDWNFPTVGPAWVDAVTLAISMHGDGLDADALLVESGAVGAHDEELVDVLLATLLGYFARARQQPGPDNSPFLRRHQGWYADVVADWLAHRRGW